MSNSNFYLMLLINKLCNFAPVNKDILFLPVNVCQSYIYKRRNNNNFIIFLKNLCENNFLPHYLFSCR